MPAASTNLDDPRILLVEGLARAASWRPAIVISDLGLAPDLDGHAVARGRRSAPPFRRWCA